MIRAYKAQSPSAKSSPDQREVNSTLEFALRWPKKAVQYARCRERIRAVVSTWGRSEHEYRADAAVCHRTSAQFSRCVGRAGRCVAVARRCYGRTGEGAAG